MTDQLIKLNSLELNRKNIWVNPCEPDEFDYSDGVDEERYFIEVLSQTDNLQLDSDDLKNACRDWVSEYHLGSVRANLLSSINLPEKAKVLEVGCGCGAITRYIGEQGMLVDAIEGSLVRAQITQLRNRDLDNVNIIQHNFNTLVLPNDHYDVILFIGVLEYAKRFINDDSLSPEQAVLALLNKASNSLADNGKIIVAIENRTGYKYQKGACEDHLALPGVGIDDYVGYEFTNIKTYDSKQWDMLINESGLKHRLFYPFGDYKFPTMTIHSQVEPKDRKYLASQIHSNDMISGWTASEGEDQHWIEALRTNHLDESANSFGLILAKKQHTLDGAFSTGWTIFDPSTIKPELRLVVKENDVNITLNNNDIFHLFNNIPEVNKSISKHWQVALFESPSLENLTELTVQLFESLEKYWPSAILVDHDQLFVLENSGQPAYGKHWKMGVEIDARQQLFHYLCGFFINNTKLLSNSGSFNYFKLSGLIQHCFKQVKNTNDFSIDEMYDFEQRYRNLTNIQPGSIEEDLDYVLSPHGKFKFKHLNTQLFWASEENAYAPDNTLIIRNKQTGKRQTYNFHDLDIKHRYLRFDPCDHDHGCGHYFYLHAIDLIFNNDQKISLIEDNLFSYTDLQLIDESKFIYRITGADPQVKFLIPAELSSNASRYNLDIQLQWLGV